LKQERAAREKFEANVAFLVKESDEVVSVTEDLYVAIMELELLTKFLIQGGNGHTQAHEMMTRREIVSQTGEAKDVIIHLTAVAKNLSAKIVTALQEDIPESIPEIEYAMQAVQIKDEDVFADILKRNMNMITSAE
jgi:hypothetical protein